MQRMEQWPDEIQPFTKWLTARKPHNILEIGVRYGGSSALWHSLSTGLVIGVDWTEKDSLGEVETKKLAEQMQTSYHRYRFICGDSHKADTKLQVEQILLGELVDFLFLDGDHSYEGLKQDWELYRSLVSPNGCIAFHDIVDSELIRSAGIGVHRFWCELVGKKTEFCIHGEWGGIGVIEVASLP
jgi:cephalosporin hydroxylase